MAYEFNGTDQYLDTSAAPVTSGPFTIACWYQTGSPTVNQTILSLNNKTGRERFQLTLNAGASRNPQLSYVSSTGGLSAVVPFVSGTAIADTWYHVAATITGVGAGVTGKCFRNGTAGGGSTSTLNVNNTINTLLTAVRYDTSIGVYLDGQVAEVGVWNVVLSNTEISSLAKGMSCDKIRPQSLVFYAPLVRDLIDARGGLTITNNNTATVAVHPRVYA